MTAGRANKRRSHAAANDVVLHDVSLRMLASRGLDLFSFSELAKEAGLTRAPIYARFDSPEDVAVDLWRTTLEPELVRLFELSRAWFRSDDEEPSKALLTAFTKPTVESSALMEAMAVARRFPSLQDIVQVSLDDLIAKYVSAQDAPRSIPLAQLSVTLGSVFLAPVVGPTVAEGWAPSLVMLRDMFRDTSAWDLPPLEVEAFEIPIGGMPTGDELVDEFLPAINTVIARVGYEHATANRISREAGRAFNVLYERFENKEALMEYVVQESIDAGARLALNPFIGVSAETYLQRSAATGRSIVAPINRPFRNLRNEMTLASRHHPPIAKDSARRYLQAARAGRTLLEANYDGVDDDTMRIVGIVGSLVRSNGFGLSLMASCTPSLADVDWTPASTCLQRAIWANLIDRLTLKG